MKKPAIIIGSLLLLYLGCHQKVVYDLETMRVEKYIHQPVHCLLDDIGRPYTDYQFIDEPPGRICGCVFVYDKDQHLIVYLAKDLHYLEEFRTDYNWDMNLFLKEKIAEIYVEKLIPGRKPLMRPLRRTR